MASRNPEQPNLLFVLTDDQGAWAMGCAGNAEIRSPNLDRLARVLAAM
jgi:arylsulfatase A-like enzyme